jgi:N-acetyl-gamma-glutamyl-phosphate reductase
MLAECPEGSPRHGRRDFGALAGRDDLEITAAGNRERKLLIARFDNLGKGASGAAIQNMNLALGRDEFEGLVTGAV